MRAAPLGKQNSAHWSEWGKQKCEKQSCNVEVREEGGKVPSGTIAEISSAAHGRDLGWSSFPLCSPLRAPCQSRWPCPEGTAAREGPVLKKAYPEGLQPIQRAHTVSVLEGLQTVQRSSTEAGRIVRRKKQQSGTLMDWPQPHSASSCAAHSREEVEELRMKEWNWACERRTGWGKVF